jgi:hypothetical protein
MRLLHVAVALTLFELSNLAQRLAHREWCPTGCKTLLLTSAYPSPYDADTVFEA